MRLTIFIFLTLISVSQAFGDVRSEQRLWLGVFSKKKITENYLFWAEAQLRYDQTHQTMNQTMNRFGLLRNLNQNHEIGWLFSFIQTGMTKEYRPTLQHIYSDNRPLNNFSLRTRLEGRDIEDSDANSLRLRSQVRLAHTLNPTYDLVVWDEAFVNLTHEQWTGNHAIDRNRFFLGTRGKYEQIIFEIGYMNQYIPRNTLSLSEHALLLYLFL